MNTKKLPCTHKQKNSLRTRTQKLHIQMKTITLVTQSDGI